MATVNRYTNEAGEPTVVRDDSTVAAEVNSLLLELRDSAQKFTDLSGWLAQVADLPKAGTEVQQVSIGLSARTHTLRSIVEDVEGLRAKATEEHVANEQTAAGRGD